MNAVYKEEAREMIRESSFSISSELFIYAKVARGAVSGNHFLVANDTDETTVITTLARVSELSLLERNKDEYTLIALNVSVPFYGVGFIATVTDAIAAAGMNVLVVSTFSKDYIMVRADLTETVRAILLSLGFSQS